MTKMLIVDDERITREGIIENLTLKEFDVTEVAFADDGINGLSKSRKWKPDIVLADVRMPRMNGIDMAIKIRELNPDCAIIFMSGYSDKQYLKAAIQLKAVRYVEKPIIIQELEEAVRSAVEYCREVNDKRQNEARRLDTLRKDLCLSITRPQEPAKFRELAEAAGVTFSDETHLATILLRIYDKSRDPKPEEWKNRLSQHVQQCSETNGLHHLLAYKDDRHIIILLYQDSKYAYRLQLAAMRRFCDSLSICITGLVRYALAVGRPVEGINSAYQSYQSAVMILQQAFYKGFDCVLLDDELTKIEETYPLNQPMLKEWIRLLESRDWIGAEGFLDELSQMLVKHPSNLVSSVKQFYAFLALAIENLTLGRSTDLSRAGQDVDPHFWELLVSMETLQEVNEHLHYILTKVRLSLEDTLTSGDSIEEIVRYIYQYYSKDDLSVAMLAEQFHVTPAYLSFLFKERTSENLNMFITRTRIDNAKELLHNRRLSIAEISGMVGIRDGNYFTKLFRKITGETPKEYRKRMLK
jgi:two-component system, response regulator YesN